MATQREYEKMRADYEKNVLGEDGNVTHMGAHRACYGRNRDAPYCEELQMISVELDQILDALRKLVALERVRLEVEYAVELRDVQQGGGERE